jgi:hypothetical protein
VPTDPTLLEIAHARCELYSKALLHLPNISQLYLDLAVPTSRDIWQDQIPTALKTAACRSTLVALDIDGIYDSPNDPIFIAEILRQLPLLTRLELSSVAPSPPDSDDFVSALRNLENLKMLALSFITLNSSFAVGPWPATLAGLSLLTCYGINSADLSSFVNHFPTLDSFFLIGNSHNLAYTSPFHLPNLIHLEFWASGFPSDILQVFDDSPLFNLKLLLTPRNLVDLDVLLPALDRFKESLRMLGLGGLDDGPPESTPRPDHRVLEAFCRERRIQLTLDLAV